MFSPTDKANDHPIEFKVEEMVLRGPPKHNMVEGLRYIDTSDDKINETDRRNV